MNSSHDRGRDGLKSPGFPNRMKYRRKKDQSPSLLSLISGNTKLMLLFFALATCSIVSMIALIRHEAFVLDSNVAEASLSKVHAFEVAMNWHNVTFKNMENVENGGVKQQSNNNDNEKQNLKRIDGSDDNSSEKQIHPNTNGKKDGDDDIDDDIFGDKTDDNNHDTTTNAPERQAPTEYTTIAPETEAASEDATNAPETEAASEDATNAPEKKVAQKADNKGNNEERIQNFNKWFTSHNLTNTKHPKPPKNKGGKEVPETEATKWNAVRISEQKRLPDASTLPIHFNGTALPVNVLDENFDAISLGKGRSSFNSEIPYLGVLLDAGRHYFPIDWIKRMIHVISMMNFNYLHFRLTDDQSFNIRLDSHPLLAYPTTLNNNTKVYSAEDLRDVVKYAKSKNVSVIPEINIPGHAASWGGIPDLIVQCPEFICENGYGIPLNVSNPKLEPILKDVLKEVIDIFDDPPFLHLGGDEVNMAQPCFVEVGERMFDYNEFESTLKKILKDIKYNEKNVIRWEMSHILRNLNRAGKITHFWLRSPESNDWKRFYRNYDYDNPIFASTGLYFDTNSEDSAFEVYVKTKRLKHNFHTQSPTLGIIGGTFELSTDFWFDRNVIGRLLAVSLGVSRMDVTDRMDFFRSYRTICSSFGFPLSMCDLYGIPPKRYRPFRRELKGGSNSIWKKWINNTCDRFTYSKEKLVSKDVRFDPRALSMTKTCFWGTYMEDPMWEILDLNDAKNKHALSLLRGERLVNYTGMIMDIAEYPWESANDTHFIDQTMAPLGLNMIQLRLVTDTSFAYMGSFDELSVQNIAYEKETIFIPQLSFLTRLKYAAATSGVAIMPEIAISTNAGGWHRSSLNADCPKILCEHGKNIPMKIHDINYPPFLYTVANELLNATSTPFIHLGHDDREVNTPCYIEAYNATPDFDAFERTVLNLLHFRGIMSDSVVRWENAEKVHYPSRFGTITQCVAGEPCRFATEDNDNEKYPWFGTVDIRRGGSYQVYSTTRDLASYSPIGIMAKVGSLRADDTEKADSTVKFRLLAFSIGTLDLPVMSKDEFVNFYTNICSEILEGPKKKNPGSKLSCKDFATMSDDAANDIQKTDEDNFAHFKNLTCQSRTKMKQVRHMLPSNRIETILSLQGEAIS